eukprot:scaffold219348_cov18-Prasinocladus_malaysianus.AAC.1
MVTKSLISTARVVTMAGIKGPSGHACKGLRLTVLPLTGPPSIRWWWPRQAAPTGCWFGTRYAATFWKTKPTQRWPRPCSGSNTASSR